MLISSTAQADDQWIVPLIGGIVGGAVIGQVIHPTYPQGYYAQPYYPPQVIYQPYPQQYYQQQYYAQPMYRPDYRDWR